MRLFYFAWAAGVQASSYLETRLVCVPSKKERVACVAAANPPTRCEAICVEQPAGHSTPDGLAPSSSSSSPPAPLHKTTSGFSNGTVVASMNIRLFLSQNNQTVLPDSHLLSTLHKTRNVTEEGYYNFMLACT